MNSLIGDRIKILRLKANLTQEELAKKINTSRSNIANYENDKNMPSVDILEKLSKELHCRADYLMGLTTESETINTKYKNNLEQILKLANGLTIQETNYLIKKLNKAKIQIEKGE